MRIRLRQLTTRPSGSKAVRERTVETGRLRIGRGSGNDLELAGLTVALEHAVFEQRDGRIWLEAIGGSELRVAGHVSSGRAVAPDDVVRIGHHELRLLEPAAGEDLLLEIEAVASGTSASAGLLARSRIALPLGPAAVRAISWTSVLVFAALAFALPVLVPPRPAGSVKTSEDLPAGTDPASPLASRLAAAWNPGALAAQHAHIAEDCAACHTAPFQAVRDDACVQCHSTIGAHRASGRAEQGPDLRRCGSCHVEHRGAGTLAALGDELCVSCHASIRTVFPDSDLVDVSDFVADHPQFRPAVVVDSGSKRRARMELATVATDAAAPLAPAPRERSGLSFPHDKHLATRLRAPVGEVTLVCADCHRPESSGATMKPVRFEEHCHRCHSLAFDERHPERQAPHEPPERVERALLEFYATQALTGEASDPEAPAPVRRRPGRELTEEERLGALAWARASASRVTAALLGRDGICEECHELASSNGPISVVPVRVVPFDGAERWLSLASFGHDAHGAVDCEDCHDARAAPSSEAVMLPSIEDCRSCHGGATGSFGAVASPCILCHEFHRAEHGPMRPVRSPRAEIAG